jgi:hypothetical protein
VKFLDQDFLCLQVSSVRSSWWSREEAWFLLEDSWNFRVQPLDAPSVAPRWARYARYQGNGWSELDK